MLTCKRINMWPYFRYHYHKKGVRTIADLFVDVDECVNSPCKNGGDCTCVYVGGYTGNNWETSRSTYTIELCYTDEGSTPLAMLSTSLNTF